MIVVGGCWRPPAGLRRAALTRGLSPAWSTAVGAQSQLALCLGPQVSARWGSTQPECRPNGCKTRRRWHGALRHWQPAAYGRRCHRKPSPWMRLVSIEQMQIARPRSEPARVEMERDMLERRRASDLSSPSLRHVGLGQLDEIVRAERLLPGAQICAPNFRLGWRIQPVDATVWLNISAGVW